MRLGIIIKENWSIHKDHCKTHVTCEGYKFLIIKKEFNTNIEHLKLKALCLKCKKQFIYNFYSAHKDLTIEQRALIRL